MTALTDVLPALRCPTCAAVLHGATGRLVCDSGHSFDVARQGYVNLDSGAGRHHGDTAAMVAARERFLAAGHYRPVVDALRPPVDDAPPGLLVDLAGGTGWYAAQLLGDRPGVVLDVSTAALRRAARAHPHLAAVGADAWGRTPLADGAAGVVLSVFGPRTAAEVQRVLGPGGLVVVVTPGDDHLGEVRAVLPMVEVGADKGARLQEAFAALHLVSRDHLTWTMPLPAVDVRDLVAMGPSAHHVDPDDLARGVAALGPTTRVTASMDVTVFRRE